MSLIPAGAKAVKLAAKYGPQAKLVWDAAGQAAADQVKARRAAATQRRRAVEKARTVVDGTVLRQLHGDQVVWVVYSGDEPITAYPLPDVDLTELTSRAELSQRITPEQYDQSRARARAKRVAARARRRGAREPGAGPQPLT
ncbi:hypothetical protein [Nocardioides sp. SYSU D00065]|uniref:hypothetical protein n=1 Tax=Nocardioides sp. SYSU D00065 TaxID=2817378 RepID=UPI001B325183|nr:hypothetical protein [Nocardioides sp. SYSU D00065]